MHAARLSARTIEAADSRSNELRERHERRRYHATHSGGQGEATHSGRATTSDVNIPTILGWGNLDPSHSSTSTGVSLLRTDGCPPRLDKDRLDRFH